MSTRSANKQSPRAEIPLPLRCQLEDILLMDCSASRSTPSGIDASIHTLHLSSSVESLSVEEEKRLLQAFASCQLQSLSESQQQAFTVQCRFLLRYSYEGTHPKREELEEFEESIVKFNAWPYFREFLQSLAQRMQFNPPPIPILKVLPKAAKAAAKAARKKLKSPR